MIQKAETVGCFKYFLVILIFLASCGAPTKLAGDVTTKVQVESTPASTDGSTPAAGGKVDVESARTLWEEPSPLDNLLNLRSISINWVVQHPDGTGDSTRIDIDNAGNMLISNSLPPEPAEAFSERLFPTPEGDSAKFFVVDGKSYYSTEWNGNWTSEPVAEEFKTTLADSLHGGEGPGYWLDLLPDGGLTAAGNEAVGGFSAHKYAVKGKVDGQEITGALWYETESGALIKVDLVVPAALYEIGKENPKGQFTVRLDTKKADIPPVELPAAPILPTDEANLAPTPVQKEVNLPAGGVSSPPVVAAAYPLDMTASGMGGFNGTLETSPGKVWVGISRIGVQERNAASGTIIQTIPLPDVAVFWDIKFDGRRLWVLASKENMSFGDVLYVVDPGGKSIIKEWQDLKQGVYDWRPVRLGLSPGKVWAANKIIDTATLEEVPMGKGFVLPAEARFAYDGHKWMWATGSRCEGCKHDLWMFDSSNPAEIKDEDGTGEAGAATLGMPLTATSERMWVAALKNIKTVNWIYTGDAYIDGYDYEKTDKPEVSVEITGELGDSGSIAALEAGSRFLWLFGTTSTSPTLYYHDLKSGKVLGKLPLETYALSDMVYDGKDLWVLGMDKLIRISQP